MTTDNAVQSAAFRSSSAISAKHGEIFPPSSCHSQRCGISTLLDAHQSHDERRPQINPTLARAITIKFIDALLKEGRFAGGRAELSRLWYLFGIWHFG